MSRCAECAFTHYAPASMDGWRSPARAATHDGPRVQAAGSATCTTKDQSACLDIIENYRPQAITAETESIPA